MEYLHPAELLHLYFSCKFMYELLGSPKARSIWITSFNHVPGFPQKVPTLKIAYLLYGIPICYVRLGIAYAESFR
jgi:hypothetical protein